MAIDTERLDIRVDVDGDRRSVQRLDRVERKMRSVSRSTDDQGMSFLGAARNMKPYKSGLLDINNNLKTSLYGNAAAMLAGLGVAAGAAITPLAGLGPVALSAVGPLASLTVTAAGAIGPLVGLAGAVPAAIGAFGQAAAVIGLAGSGMSDAMEAAGKSGGNYEKAMASLTDQQKETLKVQEAYEKSLSRLTPNMRDAMEQFMRGGEDAEEALMGMNKEQRIAIMETIKFKQQLDELPPVQDEVTRKLKEAKKADEEYAEAVKDIPPAQLKFAQTLKALKPRLDEVKKTVAGNLFPGVEAAVTRMAGRLFPLFIDVLGDTALVMGNLADEASQLFVSPSFMKNLRIMGATHTYIIREVGRAFINMIDAMGNVAVAAGPMARGMADLIKRGSEWSRTLAASVGGQDKLAAFFDKALRVATQWGRILWNLGGAFRSIFAAAAPFTQEFLSLVDRGAAWWNMTLKTSHSMGVMTAWFERGMEVSKLWGDILWDLSGTLRDVFSAAAPFADELLRGWAEGLAGLNELTNTVTAQNQMAEYFERVMEVAGQWWDILKAFSSALAGIFKAAQPAADTFLAMLLDIGTAADDWVQSMGGQEALASYFEKLSPVIEGFGRILMAIGTGFGQILGDVDLMPFVDALEEIIPNLLGFISYSMEAFGPDLIVIMGEFVELLTQMAAAGVWQAVIGFVKETLKFLTWLIDTVPGVGYLVAALGAMASVIQTANIISFIHKLTGKQGVFIGMAGGVRNFTRGLRGMGTAVAENASESGKWLARMGNRMGELVRSAATTAKDVAVSFGRMVKDAAKAAGRMAKEGLTKIGDSFASLGRRAAHAAGRVVMAFGRMIANAARAAARMVVQIGRQVVAWAVLGAQSLLHAGKVALAWLIAMGPIAIIVAAVVAAVALIIANWDTVVQWLTTAWNWLWEKGKAIFTGLRDTIVNAAKAVWNFLKEWGPLILAILTGPFGLAVYFITKHWDTILEWGGKVLGWFRELPGKLWDILSGAGEWLINTGKNIVIGLWNGLVEKGTWLKDKVVGWAKDVLPGPLEKVLGIASPSKVTAGLGEEVANGLVAGLHAGMQYVTSESAAMGQRIGENMAIGLWNGLASKADWLKQQVVDFAKAVLPGPLEDVLGISSPSKMAMGWGESVAQGLAMGLVAGTGQVKKASETLARSVRLPAGFDVAMGVKTSLPRSRAAAGLPGGSGGGVNVTNVNIRNEGSVVTERDLVESVHEGLLAKQSRTGRLGLSGRR